MHLCTSKKKLQVGLLIHHTQRWTRMCCSIRHHPSHRRRRHSRRHSHRRTLRCWAEVCVSTSTQTETDCHLQGLGRGKRRLGIVNIMKTETFIDVWDLFYLCIRHNPIYVRDTIFVWDIFLSMYDQTMLRTFIKKRRDYNFFIKTSLNEQLQLKLRYMWYLK